MSRLMACALKRNVPLLCDEDTQADAAEAFSFDQGEPTKVCHGQRCFCVSLHVVVVCVCVRACMCV
jgi:hypothetical protein